MKQENVWKNPFVGLKPFKTEESLLFFGRDEQISDILLKLHKTHFVAVVGNSGCGKSSLIYAGVIPRLQAGFLVAERDKWYIAAMKPGTSPLNNLAQVLLNIASGTPAEKSRQTFVEDMEIMGVDAITDHCESFLNEQNANLLLLVDQFEELFRFTMKYRGREQKRVASDFVSILLELTRQKQVPLYVILTMRSDFIGDCDTFYGLPVALNQSQYLVPRLTRDQQKEVIENPVYLFKQKISSRLVNRILNEDVDTHDPLPIMQHALMRTWEEWSQKSNGVLDIEHYEKIGTMKNALSLHADSTMDGMNNEEKKLTKKIFQALSDTDQSNRKIRRPARLKEIAQITGKSSEKILTILNRFIRKDRSFVIITPDKEENNPLCDISHESLLRQWQRLTKWIDEEAEDKKRFLKLVTAKEDFDRGEGSYLQGPQLQLAGEWLRVKKPTKEWADRYHDGFPGVKKFIEESDKKSKASLRAENIKLIILIASFTIFLILLGIFSFSSSLSAYKAEKALTEYYWLNANNALRNGNTVMSSHFFAKAGSMSNKELIINQSYYNIQFPKQMIKLEYIGKADSTIISPDWHYILTWDSGIVQLWNTKKSSFVFTFQQKEAINTARISSDQQFILTGSDDTTAKLWDVKNSALVFTMQHDGAVHAAEFSPDQQFILTLSEHNITRLWNRERKSLVFAIQHDKPVHDVEISPDQQYIYALCSDNTARLWDMNNGSLIFSMQHNDEVLDAEFSPDQRYILTRSEDQTVKLWDVKNSTLVFTIEHIGEVRDAEFSPDQRYILIISSLYAKNYTATLWNAKSGSLVYTIDHEKPVNNVTFSPDQRYILLQSRDNTAKLWNRDNNSLVFAMQHYGYVHSAEFSPDQQYILTSSDDTTAKLWDVKKRSLVFTLHHEDRVYDARFSPDQQFIITACSDNIIRLWNLKNGSLISTLHHDDNHSRVEFSPDHQFILTSSILYTKLWKIEPGSRDFTIHHKSSVNGAAFSSDQQYILTWGTDTTAQLRNARDGTLFFSMQHNDSVTRAEFSPDRKYILTLSRDQTVRLWNTKDGSEMYTLKQKNNLFDAVFSPDQRFVLTGNKDTIYISKTEDGSNVLTIHHKDIIKGALFSPDQRFILTWGRDIARLWNVKDGTEVYAIQYEDNVSEESDEYFKSLTRNNVNASFSPDQKYILTWKDFGNTARLWSVKDGSLVFLMQHDKKIDNAIFSPDQEHILTWGYQGFIKLWNISNKSLDFTIHPSLYVGQAIFSPNQRYILTWSSQWPGDRTARLWNSKNKNRIFILQHNDEINGAAFSPDEQYILTWSDDNTAKLWDIKKKSLIFIMQHSDDVKGAAFSPDQQFILTWGDDNTVRVWDIKGDFNFPKKYLPLLVEVRTGTKMDTYGEITDLSKEEWEKRRKKHEKIIKTIATK